MGFRYKQVIARERPLVNHICHDDINLIACCWSWLEKDTNFPTISLDFCIMLEFVL
jgi:hypothetical protein